jgi:hypothetical protein
VHANGLACKRSFKSTATATLKAIEEEKKKKELCKGEQTHNNLVGT